MNKPWLLLTKCGSLLYYFLSVIYENDNKERPLTTFEQFSKRRFGEIRNPRLTASPYIRY